MANRRMLSENHRGWTRVWDLLAAKLPGYLSYEYVHTLNDTHMFRRVGSDLKWAHATVRDGDFDELPGVMEPRVDPPTLTTTIEERIASYRAALQQLMDEYPDSYANLPFVTNYIMSKVGTVPAQFHFVHEDIRQFLIGLENRGEVETKRGGLLLKWLKAPDGEMIPTVVPATPANNYTCTRCKCAKLNTSNDKVCWSCGEPVAGYIGG